MDIAFGFGLAFGQGLAQVSQSDPDVFQPLLQAQVWAAPFAVHVPWPWQVETGGVSQPVGWPHVLPL